MAKAISVDEAIKALVAEAEAHEKSESGEFCVGTRVSMIVFAMLHLGLGLDAIGFLARDLAEALDVNEEKLAEESGSPLHLVAGVKHGH